MSIGNWIVGVRPDSPRTSRSIRRAFAKHLVEQDNPARSNLSIRRERRRVRSWVVYIGGDVAFRVNTRQRAIAVVGELLGEIAVPDDLSGRIRLRAFARDSRVVLFDHQRPTLVDDAELKAAGIKELPVWEPLVDAERQLMQLAPTLGSAGDPPQPPRLYRVAGIVTGGVAADGKADVIGLWRNFTDQSEPGFDLLNAVQQRDAISVALGSDQARQQILWLMAESL